MYNTFTWHDNYWRYAPINTFNEALSSTHHFPAVLFWRVSSCLLARSLTSLSEQELSYTLASPRLLSRRSSFLTRHLSKSWWPADGMRIATTSWPYKAIICDYPKKFYRASRNIFNRLANKLHCPPKWRHYDVMPLWAAPTPPTRTFRCTFEVCFSIPTNSGW